MTTSLTEVEHTVLEFREGSSDKIYMATLYKYGDDGYNVIFRYGKRYNVNSRVMKPEHGSVSHAEAMMIYHDQLQKKLKKGYVKTNNYL